MIDIAFIFLIFYFTISGLLKGFLVYFFEFLLVSACVIVSWLYYRGTHNFLYSLIILFFSPIVLVTIVKYGFHFSAKKIQEIKPSILTHLNYILGGLIGFFWGVIWIIAISSVINILPIDNTGIIKVKDNLADSYVMSFAKTALPFKEFFLVDTIDDLSRIINDPKAMENLKNYPRFQELMKEKKIQDFIKDRTVVAQLKNKQILSLFDNPKFLSILEDRKLLRKFIQVDFESVLIYAREYNNQKN